MTNSRALCLVAAMLLAAGCSADKVEESPGDAYYGFVEGDTTGAGAISLKTLHYDDATDDVTTTSGSSWSVSDPGIAELKTDGSPRLIPKKSGTLIVTAGGGNDPLRVTFTAYTKAEWETGRKRYEEGRDDKSARACKSCHAKGLVAEGVHDHFLSSYKDEQLLHAAEQGYSTFWDEPVNNGDHKWTFTAEERVGIVAYLRSLDESRQIRVFED